LVLDEGRLYVRARSDEGTYAVGDATLQGFGRTREADVQELSQLVTGSDQPQATPGQP
jgi:L-alanine-DL-glutamate epimerase-like enolase superfamily enzyme